MQSVVEIKNLTYATGDLVILDDVSLTIEKGEFTAIIGPNGAGKTTLLRSMLGLITPTSGTIRLFGKSVKTGRAQTGYVPQSLAVDRGFPISVYEAVIMGTYSRLGIGKRIGEKEHKDTKKALETVGVWDLKDRPISRLSGGQRQRVFIARAIVNSPRLLILDEPTTGVDAATTESLYTLLKELRAAGVTIVMVTHDVGVVASFIDKIACLNRTIISHCMPRELKSNHALEQMYGCDAAYLHHCDCVVVEEHEHES